jgi:alkylhydroperoxidase family enzyme
LLGAVRRDGKLPGDLRELMVSKSCPFVLASVVDWFVDYEILRVAAHNHAAFEWIHHEDVGRDAGLTTAQLIAVRDILKPAPSPSAPGPLSSLQAAALAFTDASTKEVKVPDIVFDTLANELKSLSGKQDVVEETVQDFLVEAVAVVATYNMVSRFLVSLDIAGKSDELVPWPLDRKEVRPT